MEELKPCPFCGSKQVEVRQIKDGWSIGCATTNCLCQWWFIALLFFMQFLEEYPHFRFA